jgi:RES domain-containing protein
VITAWRIVKARYAEDAFSGIASRRQGGRWNPIGVPVVYTSATVSLASLELLAHIESDVVNEFTLISCSFHEALIETVEDSRLPRNWSAVPPPRELQTIGFEWYTSRASAVLAVPSAVLPMEMNYLLNPDHPDFRSIDIGAPRPFKLDFRLLT